MKQKTKTRKSQLEKMYSAFTNEALLQKKSELEGLIHNERLDAIKELYRKQAYFVRNEMKIRGIN